MRVLAVIRKKEIPNSISKRKNNEKLFHMIRPLILNSNQDCFHADIG